MEAYLEENVAVPINFNLETDILVLMTVIRLRQDELIFCV